jgi:hypothetical protein
MGFETIAKRSIPQLQRQIRTTAADAARIFLTSHVKARMKSRKVNVAEVFDVLRKGTIREQPEPNVLKGSLECRMERYVGGRECAVVVALDDENPDLLVVTVWVC